MNARLPFAACLICALALAAPACAGAVDMAAPKQEQVAPYSVDWYTNDGGGGASVSLAGNYRITGTIGQPDADPLQPATGGTYQIDGGFWGGASADAKPDALFHDSFEAP